MCTVQLPTFFHYSLRFYEGPCASGKISWAGSQRCFQRNLHFEALSILNRFSKLLGCQRLSCSLNLGFVILQDAPALQVLLSVYLKQVRGCLMSLMACLWLPGPVGYSFLALDVEETFLQMHLLVKR